MKSISYEIRRGVCPQFGQYAKRAAPPCHAPRVKESGMLFVLGRADPRCCGIFLAYVRAALRVSVIVRTTEVINARLQICPHDRIAWATAARKRWTRHLRGARWRGSVPSFLAAICLDRCAGNGPTIHGKAVWGDNPPYHAPVFVLTHHARASVEMAGGTIFQTKQRRKFR
jgi:hypothetical protein